MTFRSKYIKLILKLRGYNETKKKKGQFDLLRRWCVGDLQQKRMDNDDEGYTFVAETKEDHVEYLKHMGHANLGKLREVTDSE